MHTGNPQVFHSIEKMDIRSCPHPLHGDSYLPHGIGMWLILPYLYKISSEGVDTSVRRPSRIKTV